MMPTNSRHVVLAGSANLNFVVCASNIPAPAETVLGKPLIPFPLWFCLIP